MRIEHNDMTIVAGVSSSFDSVVLADSRLARVDDRGNLVVARDICQKLIVANSWSLIGFAGHLCLARHVLATLVARLRDTPIDAPDWLRDDEELLGFIRSAIDSHVREVADHRPCQHQPIELLVAWVDHTRSIIAGDHKPGDDRFIPGTELIAMQSPTMAIRRTRLGFDIIGSGAIITPQMENTWLNIVQFGGGHDPHGWLFASVVVRHLVGSHGLTTVGGVHQVVHLSYRGVQIMPHMYWVPVEPGYGTYVAMRIEDGYWIQEHRPTGVKVRVMSPFDIHLRGPRWQAGRHEMFDPARTLTRQSPGVVPAPNPVMKFWPYDPTDVPDEIKSSWGDDPLPPLTFAQLPER